jgi:hypothetical protein
MSLIVIGEAATGDGWLRRVHEAHADVPWRSMRVCVICMAHGYFDINLDVVWETVQEWLPALLQQAAHGVGCRDEDRNDKGMHDQSAACFRPLAAWRSIPRPAERARARPSGWPQRT